MAVVQSNIMISQKNIFWTVSYVESIQLSTVTLISKIFTLVDLQLTALLIHFLSFFLIVYVGNVW